MVKTKTHYFYKIENAINGNFYYGVHSTNNINDGYMGSGIRIRNAIKKYGLENFKKEILLFFDTAKEAFNYEMEVVNEVLIQDVSCYNLKCGGEGGNNGKGEEWYKNHFSNIIKTCWLDEEFRKRHYIRRSKGDGFVNKHHSEESKNKMKIKAKLRDKTQNSQYGTCWITNEKENKKIHRGDLIPDGWKLGRKV